MNEVKNEAREENVPLNSLSEDEIDLSGSAFRYKIVVKVNREADEVKISVDFITLIRPTMALRVLSE